MGIALEDRGSEIVIVAEGTVDIASAAELKATLIAALDSGKPVRVSCDAMQYLDLTAIQLLWAAAREAGLGGVKFSLDGQLRESASILLAGSGFSQLQAMVNGGPVAGS